MAKFTDCARLGLEGRRNRFLAFARCGTAYFVGMRYSEICGLIFEWILTVTINVAYKKFFVRRSDNSSALGVRKLPWGALPWRVPARRKVSSIRPPLKITIWLKAVNCGISHGLRMVPVLATETLCSYFEDYNWRQTQRLGKKGRFKIGSRARRKHGYTFCWGGEVIKHQRTRLVMTIFMVLVSGTWFCCGQKAHATTAVEIQQWLQAHNQLRSLHGVPPVTWSATLAESAQAWANTCPLPGNHSNWGYGENMHFATGSIADSDDCENYENVIECIVKDGWYVEQESLYDYNNPEAEFNLVSLHFTQIVWKSTTEIGCGYRTDCGGDWPYVSVCQYNPPGNVIGDFADNVFPKVISPAPPPQSEVINIIPDISPLLLSD